MTTFVMGLLASKETTELQAAMRSFFTTFV